MIAPLREKRARFHRTKLMSFPSIHSLKTGSLLLAALAATALPALAGETTVTTKSTDKNPVIEKPKTEQRFYVNLLAGGEFDTGVTDFIGDGKGVPPGPPTAVAGIRVTTANIQARNFEETHDAAVINGRLELGYKVKPWLSLFVGFTYSHAGGDSRADVGYVRVTNPLIIPNISQDFALHADVGRYQAFAGRAGFKLTTPRTLLDLLHIPRAIKPYASFSAGGKYVDSQSIRFYTDNPGIVGTYRSRLYDDSWVFSVEGSLGYDLQLTSNLDVILESGYGYDTKPDGDNIPGVSGVNTKGSRVYSTVSLGAKLKF